MAAHRVDARGKFLFAGRTKFFVKGVAYGTFAPDAAGEHFPPLARIADDFAAMQRWGVNTVRTYTPPSLPMLDRALDAGLRVIVGLPWTQHVAFLDDPRGVREVRRSILAAVERLGTHPAVLMFALGNEIPASVVRWHGKARTERFVRELYDDSKAISPASLFTYVNYPPTEYLELPFLDVCAFNIYLHQEPELRRYLARLQHIAGHRPLLVAEVGADSIREGLDGQAALTSMQIRTAFSEGACGAVAFTWTDEWWRGGADVDDWAFGLVDRERRPKPAAAAVADAFREVPFPAAEQRTWPRASAVVCAYNAASTLDECLTALDRLTYPDYEIIVVNDGSTDATGSVARRHPRARVIDTPNHGLSAARNAGLAAATGAIVAYTDADARADPDWLSYLVQPMLRSPVVAAGGPNTVPADDPWVAQCVARAPGGPTHVLLDDRIAEHVPGCNMAFRRDALAAIGGFNPIYVRAGDDVDVCWRLQARGWTLGFAPAALVWHRHRASVGAYWRQQIGYGEGEGWLKPHHPDKFAGSHIRWRGHIYSPLPFIKSLTATRINAGTWGTALFPSVYRTAVHPLLMLPNSIPWQVGALALLLVAAILALGSADMQRTWSLALGGIGLLALATTAAQCVRYARASDIQLLSPIAGRSLRVSRLASYGLIALLHFLQPLARANGRVRAILSPPELDRSHDPSPRASATWRELVHAATFLRAPQRVAEFWSEQWTSGDALLQRLVDRVRSTRLAAMEIDDGWHATRDVSLQLGRWAWLDVRLLVEEHTKGNVLVRFARHIRLTPFCLASTLVFVVSAVAATVTTTGRLAAAALALVALTFLLRGLWRSAATLARADRLITAVLLQFGATPLNTAARRLAADLARHPEPRSQRMPAGVDPVPAADISTIRPAEGAPQHAG